MALEIKKTFAALPIGEVDSGGQRSLVNLSWLIKLRWVACLGQLLVIAVVIWQLDIPLPFPPLAAVIGLTLLTNVGLAVWYQRRLANRQQKKSSERLAGAILLGIMILDLFSLATLLYWTGGPNNPFSLFFFVNLSLAGVLLPRGISILFHLLSACCFGVLLIVHEPLNELNGPGALQPIYTGDWELRHLGAFIAFLTCSSVIVYFLTRLTNEMQQQEADLREIQRRQGKSEKYEALGTLAAGAAHELSTPLSTIALVAKEAEGLGKETDCPDELTEDLTLIRSEVDRCRRILDRMAVGAGQVIGESFGQITPQKLLEDVMNELGTNLASDVKTNLDRHSQTEKIEVPPIAMAQALRGLVKNAIDAKPARGPVRVTSQLSQKWVLEVRDEGPGMNRETLERVSEPFFTTKDPGSGMGLGVFLARSVIERLGGELTIESEGGEGTIVTVRLPRSQSNT